MMMFVIQPRYPEISQQERWAQDRDCVCARDGRASCLGAKVRERERERGRDVGGMLTLAASGMCYYSLSSYNKFALFICLCSQHKQNQPPHGALCDIVVNKS